ncbi:MAG: hypothetical protein MN733_10335 [Nitrososphaera sp.]|nr:hypothetical protein [Nitrososphaera sp.]
MKTLNARAVAVTYLMARFGNWERRPVERGARFEHGDVEHYEAALHRTKSPSALCLAAHS